jgi:hypothetical protein
MTMTGDELRTAATFVAIAISLLSMYVARRSWIQSNRPIVTAFIAAQRTGNLASVFKLVVANSGSRPAVNVRLRATAGELRKLVKPTATEALRDRLGLCFAEPSTIAVLRNGEELSTAFGAVTAEDAWLEYGAKIDVTVSYSDLDGRAFQSVMPLKVHTREGFGGARWESGA